MVTIYSKLTDNFEFNKKILRAVVQVGKGENSDIYYISEFDIANALEEAFKNSKQYTYKLTKEELKDFRTIKENSNKVPAFLLEEHDARYDLSKHRTVASCAYNATENYLSNNFGVKFHFTDRDWYSKNSLVTEDGLPLNNTFQVLEQLVEPYGFRISNIQLNRGTMLGKDNMKFLKALGCNPFCMTDNSTSNEEAYQKLYPDSILDSMISNGIITSKESHKKQIFNSWRVEYRDYPTGSSVTMCQFDKLKVGHNGGSSYAAPRSERPNPENWIFSIKFDRADNCNFEKVNLLEYKEFEGNEVLNIWRSIFNGKPLSQFRSKKDVFKTKINDQYSKSYINDLHGNLADSIWD